MTRQVLVWPVGKEALALNYADMADNAYANLTGNPTDVWCHRNRFDRHGQQVTAYFGPTGGEYNGEVIPEPTNCLQARGDAVLASSVDWPDDD